MQNSKVHIDFQHMLSFNQYILKWQHKQEDLHLVLASKFSKQRQQGSNFQLKSSDEASLY